MRSVVCLKVVPRPEEVRVNLEAKTLERSGVRSVINPADLNALETALAIRDRYGGRVTVLSMGPPSFEPYLRVAIAVGADEAVLLSDRAFGGADTLATSYTLAQGIQAIGGADLVLCGDESSDGGTSQVPQGIAEWLDAAQATYVDRLEVPREGILRARRLLEDGTETLEVSLPAVVSVLGGANEVRFIDYDRWAMAEQASIRVIDAVELGADRASLGLPGSPTVVAGLREVRKPGRRHEVLTLEPGVAAARLAEELRRLGVART
ncbi:MAG TPA: electron transfer flavoprotein subunit beta/FixA family protein [Thermoplasmata archaeon]|jgi:electron transfer flavoprotein beta subunit|nr:electron transfer flavoprotein subunit beta/FixA family protein [Thermoplasmata archaeon]HYB78714.1 electron transfer flavoprotein subunit beta/FixA family protein [Thermoplasmata archaeon]